jgi:hypothetical protein
LRFGNIPTKYLSFVGINLTLEASIKESKTFLNWVAIMEEAPLMRRVSFF